MAGTLLLLGSAGLDCTSLGRGWRVLVKCGCEVWVIVAATDFLRKDKDESTPPTRSPPS